MLLRDNLQELPIGENQTNLRKVPSFVGRWNQVETDNGTDTMNQSFDSPSSKQVEKIKGLSSLEPLGMKRNMKLLVRDEPNIINGRSLLFDQPQALPRLHQSVPSKRRRVAQQTRSEKSMLPSYIFLPEL